MLGTSSFRKAIFLLAVLLAGMIGLTLILSQGDRDESFPPASSLRVARSLQENDLSVPQPTAQPSADGVSTSNDLLLQLQTEVQRINAERRDLELQLKVAKGKCTAAAVVPPAAQVALAPTETKARKGNIVMFKTHKTGSTTLGSVLFRFGARHGRRFLYTPDHYALPWRDDLEAQRGANIFLQHHHPKTMTFANLVAFYSTYIKNPAFISVLREPTKRFHSAFRYFWEPFRKGTNLAEFAAQPAFKNQQSHDFGIHTQAQMDRFLASEIHKMDFVVITERYDESLLLLKRKFNWELEDILYIRLLDTCQIGRNYAGLTMKCGTPPDANEPHTAGLVAEANALDKQLYDAFLGRLEAEIAKQDASFYQELEAFQVLMKDLRDRCRREIDEIIKFPGVALRKTTYCTQYILDDTMYEEVISDSKGFPGRVLADTNSVFSDDV